MKSILSFLLMLTLIVPYAEAATKISKYEVPNVKDSYCGSVINFQYCKCAFHNKYCKSVNMTPGSAHTYVLGGFKEWNKIRIQEKAEKCELSEGYWDINNWSCTTCTDGDVLKGNRCVESDESVAERKECEEALKNFDKEWEKYSDFDDRLGGTSVSWEVQQFNKELDDIAELVGLANEIKYEMAIMAEVRLEMRAYKAALVQNIKVNLLKSFWRLSYISYTTIKGGLGMDGTIKKIISPENTAQGVGAGLKLIQSVIPPYDDAKDLQIDTSTTVGKIKSIAWNATLETLESVGKPGDVAQQLMKDVRGAVIPSPDITPEEVEILRTQHLSNNAIDEALADSYAEAAELRRTLIGIEKTITSKYNKMQNWKVEEYKRVKGNLEDQCKDKIE